MESSLSVDRLENATWWELGRVAGLIARGYRPTVQFSRPTVSSLVLRKINQFCRKWGEALEVRFYGH